ncbi:peptidyl-prolyl cis-trans isomerase-like 3 [Fusarium pseudocircinatum]|uniref:Peptidyl-prolyl cis-trans isomerase n=1 Tax=Fusarium pseudocircinatum TaxID=56676 RepID=A0A8H5LFE4_9HYPO|nr:peptidyl-prolyl cis-trans isomerase-like 3 [Fusarium pseudocircinatum]
MTAKVEVAFATLRNTLPIITTMSVTLHTSHGDIKVEIYCESVPKTAENFLALCGSGYYDKSPFHRLIPKFMAQTGAPATPNPPENPKGGRSIWGGAFADEIRPALRHGARGMLSMANKGPGTNGSQFFITFDKTPHLDGLNTVFGRVIGDEGMATLAKMEAIEVDRKNRPKEPVRIENVTIHANPIAG